MLNELPQRGLDLTHGEEVEQDDVVELEAFRLVDREAEHALHELRQFFFDALVTHNDHLARTKLGSDHVTPGNVLACRGLLLITIFVIND